LLSRNPRLKGILLASFTTLLWGFLAIALKVATNFASSATIVWFRFLVAFIILFIYFLFTGKQKLNILFRPPLLMLVAAACLGVNYIGFMQGIHYTTPQNAQIIIQMGPILLALVGVLIYRERLTVRQASGFLIAGVGFIFFYRIQLGNLITDKSAFNQGVLWVIFAAICWTVYASLTKKLIRSWSAQQVNLVAYGFSAIAFLPFVNFQTLPELLLWQWIFLAILGLNTLLAYGALAASFKYLEANKVSIIITLNPIITVVSMTFLATLEVTWITTEKLTLPALLGAGLVLCGAILAVKPARKQAQ
jgi:drug/metabolite transporter (DMT)-like permease